MGCDQRSIRRANMELLLQLALIIASSDQIRPDHIKSNCARSAHLITTWEMRSTIESAALAMTALEPERW